MWKQGVVTSTHHAVTGDHLPRIVCLECMLDVDVVFKKYYYSEWLVRWRCHGQDKVSYVDVKAYSGPALTLEALRPVDDLQAWLEQLERDVVERATLIQVLEDSMRGVIGKYDEGLTETKTHECKRGPFYGNQCHCDPCETLRVFKKADGKHNYCGSCLCADCSGQRQEGAVPFCFCERCAARDDRSSDRIAHDYNDTCMCRDCSIARSPLWLNCGCGFGMTCDTCKQRWP